MIVEGDRESIRDSVKRLVMSKVDESLVEQLHAQDGVMLVKNLETETQVLVRDLHGEKLEKIRSVTSTEPQLTDLTLEDVFEAYTVWAKNSKGSGVKA